MTKLTGRNNTWEPHMSQWQKDNASAPFEHVSEPWYKALALWLFMLVSCVLWLGAGVWYVHHLQAPRTPSTPEAAR